MINLTFIIISIFFFYSCNKNGGDGGVTSGDSGNSNDDVFDAGYVISHLNSLPACNQGLEGRLYFISVTSSFKGCSNGSWVDVNTTGSQGPTGAQGVQGPQGVQGIQGSIGPSVGVFKLSDDSFVAHLSTLCHQGSCSELYTFSDGAHFVHKASSSGVALPRYGGYIYKGGGGYTIQVNTTTSTGNPTYFNTCYYPNTSCTGSCGYYAQYEPIKNSLLMEYDSSGNARFYKVGASLVNLGSYDFYNDLSFRRANGTCQVFSSDLYSSELGNLIRSNTSYTPSVNLTTGEETYIGVR
jgi:hypothetical protein